MMCPIGERAELVVQAAISSSRRCRFRPRSITVRSTAISTGFAQKQGAACNRPQRVLRSPFPVMTTTLVRGAMRNMSSERCETLTDTIAVGRQAEVHDYQGQCVPPDQRKRLRARMGEQNVARGECPAILRAWAVLSPRSATWVLPFSTVPLPHRSTVTGPEPAGTAPSDMPTLVCVSEHLHETGHADG